MSVYLNYRQELEIDNDPDYHYTTPKERDSIDLLLNIKRESWARLLRFQQARRGLEFMHKLALKSQDEFALQTTTGPIDQTFTRMDNNLQQMYEGILRSISRVEKQISDCNSKIADLQRKAHKRNGDADADTKFDSINKDINDLLAEFNSV